jgi:uncharacterized Fe-S radical SAM superfamily protein PflX
MRVARYLIVKRIPVKRFSWEEHRRALEQYEILKRRIDSGENDIENINVPKKSLFDLKIELAKQITGNCEFCEHFCRINRGKGEKGFGQGCTS